jgi:hypothetical protein
LQKWVVANLIRVYYSITIKIPGNTHLEEDLAYELQGVKMTEKHQNKPDDVTTLPLSLIDVENVTEEQFMATKPWIGALVAPSDSKTCLM